MDKQLLDILDKYFQTGQLPSLTPQLLEELNITEQEFQEMCLTMDDFLVAMKVFGRQELKKEIETWKGEMDEEELGEAQQITDGLDNFPDANLKRAFTPQPLYQGLVNGTNRNKPLSLVVPLNGFDWNTHSIDFQLTKDFTASHLSFQIENNQNVTLFNDTIDIVNYQFSLDLDWKKLHPGRYYLKLIDGNKVAIFEFFIRKDLMPD